MSEEEVTVKERADLCRKMIDVMYLCADPGLFYLALGMCVSAGLPRQRVIDTLDETVHEFVSLKGRETTACVLGPRMMKGPEETGSCESFASGSYEAPPLAGPSHFFP